MIKALDLLEDMLTDKKNLLELLEKAGYTDTHAYTNMCGQITGIIIAISILIDEKMS